MTDIERESWLRQRQQGIGSSDAANLIGIGYGRAIDVYNSKIDPVGTGKVEAFLQRGIDLEPIIARKYAEAMGKELVSAGFVTNAERPWQISNPDFLGCDDRYTEIKSVLSFGDEWGEQFTSHVPERYWVQCQHQMGTRGGGCDHMDVAAFELMGWALRIYRIPFDSDFFAWLTAIEARAWFKHVVPRKPFGPAWEDQFKDEYLRRIVQRDRAIVLDAEYGPKLEELQELKDVVKAAEAAIEPLKDSIQRAMGTVEVAHCADWKIKRIVTSNNQLRLNFTRKKEGKK